MLNQENWSPGGDLKVGIPWIWWNHVDQARTIFFTDLFICVFLIEFFIFWLHLRILREIRACIMNYLIGKTRVQFSVSSCGACGEKWHRITFIYECSGVSLAVSFHRCHTLIHSSHKLRITFATKSVVQINTCNYILLP